MINPDERIQPPQPRLDLQSESMASAFRVYLPGMDGALISHHDRPAPFATASRASGAYGILSRRSWSCSARG